MLINELLESKGITKYRLAKDSGIPYATICDICSGKAKLEKCTVETIYRISKTLGVSMETLIEPYFEKRIDFELFKSNTCHKLRRLGDIDFIINLLEEDNISIFYNRGWYPESLYLLAMLDYISRLNNVPICSNYDDLRRLKLKHVLYPASVLIAAKSMKNDAVLQQSMEEAIPEFMRFNIVESEVRNVI